MTKRDIILSIKTQWVDKIISGEKTIELRKTFPDTDEIGVVYIYRSQACKTGNNAVVGSFIPKTKRVKTDFIPSNLSKTGLTIDEYREYTKSVKYVNLVQITDLVIFEKPLPLSHFGVTKPSQNYRYI